MSDQSFFIKKKWNLIDDGITLYNRNAVLHQYTVDKIWGTARANYTCILCEICYSRDSVPFEICFFLSQSGHKYQKQAKAKQQQQQGWRN